MTKNEKVARAVLKYFHKELKDAPCSTKHHLNVRGGLLEHLNNVHEVAMEYFPENNNLRFLALVHDIGKARCYTWTKGDAMLISPSYTEPSIDHIIHTIEMLHEFGVTLTKEELNALQFHHGGWSKFEGNLTELAVKLHFCDLLATIKEDEKE